jgi:cyclohexanecarboxyl-CoA dehydrogenase
MIAMLDFSFTEEQNMIRSMVRDFAQKEIAPGYKERVRTESIPREMIKKMADIGLMGLNIPEEYGGQPRDAVTVGLIIEELARHATDAALLVFYNYGPARFIMLASDDVRKEWLPAMARGEKMVIVAATEAEAGSDLGNLKTTARKDGDCYILNGEKNRTTFAYQGHATIVLAKTDPASRRITPFLVPLDLPGVSIARIDDMGVESTLCGIVSLEDVRIPKKYLLGDEEGKGFVEAMITFDFNRVFLALMAMAKAEVSLEETCAYTKQRVQFGKPLAKFEGISFKLAEAATYVELGRWLCYRALWMKDNGMRHSKEAAMVKWWCTRTAFNIIHECLLTHGHYGYSKDLPFEQRLRDVVSVEIGDGTTEVMKLIITREILGREYLPY